MGDFGSQFVDQMEQLEWFFHRKLKTAKIMDEIEQVKKDLVQDTAEAVLRKLHKEKYGDYHLVALIWTKAKDAWINYIRSSRAKLFMATSPEELRPPPMELAHNRAYEIADWIASMQSAPDINLKSWQMFLMHLEGYRYKEIAECYQMSEVAVKVAIHRLKIILKRSF